jgi:hypothetical protein
MQNVEFLGASVRHTSAFLVLGMGVLFQVIPNLAPPMCERGCADKLIRIYTAISTTGGMTHAK